jgi:hypothetical protein
MPPLSVENETCALKLAGVSMRIEPFELSAWMRGRTAPRASRSRMAPLSVLNLESPSKSVP